MNRHDIHLLQQIRGYPALTITLPTHRTSPDNLQDPIRVRNLVTQAANRLLAEFKRREVDPLLVRLERLANEIDYRYTLDGLALYVNRDFARAFHLPFKLKERVVVGETFATRDLVFALNRSPRYWTVVLSEKPTRLLEGSRDTLMELTEGGFPMTHEGPGGAAPLPGGFGVRKSAYRDERHRQFFRRVDAALKPILAEDPLPLVVVGVDRFLAFFNEVTAHKDAILTTLTGSHDKTAPHELAKLVWPLVEVNLHAQRQQALTDLERATGERKVASTVGEVWRFAHEGRGALLLVEEDFHYPAQVDPSGQHLSPANDPTGADVLDDAVDEIIEIVLSKQGRVVFLDNGQLAEHQRIALILRY
jgi:hypothetical protein